MQLSYGTSRVKGSGLVFRIKALGFIILGFRVRNKLMHYLSLKKQYNLIPKNKDDIYVLCKTAIFLQNTKP